MDLLTTSAAARLLNMTTDNVRYHEREGHLLALRVQRGSGVYMRLFIRQDIERFQRQRTVTHPAPQNQDVGASDEGAFAQDAPGWSNERKE